MPPPLVIEDSLYLRKRLVGADNGAGNQLRKKCLEQKKLGKRACWPVPATHDVDVIGQSLKTVKRNAKRERGVDKTAGHTRLPKEHVSVFEVADQPDINDDRGPDAASVGWNGNLDQPIECDRAQEHEHIE